MSSALSRTEVLRALRSEGDVALAWGRDALARIDMIRVNDRILYAAGLLAPPDLRSLDAIHLATADQLGPDLGQLVTYDQRMLAAARRLGFNATSPA